jgi:murein hydrolase activator
LKFHKDIRELTKIVLLILVALPPALLSGQGRNELEDKRKRLIQEIQQTQKLLEQTQKNKTATLNRYFALQNQVQKRQELVQTLKEEIHYSDEGIERANEVVGSLQRDAVQLENEYVKIIRTAFRLKMSKSLLLFLFSAESFNDAFRRWQYIRQYDRYRKKQARLIMETQKSLEAKAQQLQERKTEKEELLASQEQQQELLRKELREKDQILASLKKDETRLIAGLKEQQEAHQRLNNAIENVIREEMARRRNEARSPEALSKNIAGTDDDSPLSGDFQRNKGRLPWPVANGFITRHFGAQPHPTAKEIEILNNGIDIRTDEKAEVFSVFEGKVVATGFIQGYKRLVIIQHGQYYTAYSNLEVVYVNKDDKVKAKQAIGAVNKDKPEVHFEVWKEKQRLNPANWVTKR